MRFGRLRINRIQWKADIGVRAYRPNQANRGKIDASNPRIKKSGFSDADV